MLGWGIGVQRLWWVWVCKTMMSEQWKYKYTWICKDISMARWSATSSNSRSRLSDAPRPARATMIWLQNNNQKHDWTIIQHTEKGTLSITILQWLEKNASISVKDNLMKGIHRLFFVSLVVQHTCNDSLWNHRKWHGSGHCYYPAALGLLPSQEQVTRRAG